MRSKEEIYDRLLNNYLFYDEPYSVGWMEYFNNQKNNVIDKEKDNA